MAVYLAGYAQLNCVKSITNLIANYDFKNFVSCGRCRTCINLIREMKLLAKVDINSFAK